LHDLLSRRWAVDDPRAQLHIGDLYWFLRVTADGDPLSDTRVWPRADGSLAAFAWLDPPQLGDAIVDPADEIPMLDEALVWLEAEFCARGHSSITVVVVDGDRARVEALTRRGYAPGEGGNARLWHRLRTEPSPPALPSGFALGHVSSERDLERRAFVETDSFDIEGVTVTADRWRVLSERLPDYRPDLDLLAIAPDGGGASASTVWYDEATRCGEFEAVGTSKAYRRKGLARAVITEGLRRLRDLGATTAVVYTQMTNDSAIALYRSCGFEIAGQDCGWTRRL
jgi:ribosomal protein S18 acetylase RimI-like enzyme